MKYIDNLRIELLTPHPDNPRKDLGDLTELAASIMENGVLQNLTVVPHEDGYRVIIGHRRLEAAKLAGLTEVPCVIVDMSPKEQVQTMLLENMQRADLTVYEQAQGFQMMLDLGATVEEIAEKSGFSQRTVRRRVKMMELDQAKLKEVSARQLSLGDFDTLAQIEDIAERNAVLDSIGTRDFDAKVSRALNKQEEKKRLPLVKKWLKDHKAKAIKQNETWGNKYDRWPGTGYIYISRWGEDNCKPPENVEGEIFYYLDGSTSVSLYKKHVKPPKEPTPPEELARKRAERAAWNKLEESAALAYGLRKQFVEKLALSGKNRQAILFGALPAALLMAIGNYTSNTDAMLPMLGLKYRWDQDRDDKIAAWLKEGDDKELPTMIYDLFGDDEKQCCVKYTRGPFFPKYKLNARLQLIYDWLCSLGYELSTEEQSILDGTHESYLAGEAYEKK